MDKHILFYVYGDGADTPYIIKNPPDNLRALLDEWNELDRHYIETDDDSNWQPVNEWLRAKGIDIIEPDEIVDLIEAVAESADE